MISQGCQEKHISYGKSNRPNSVVARSKVQVSGSNSAGARMSVSCDAVCCHVWISALGRSLVQRSSTEYVSSSVIKCKNKPLHLQWVSRQRSRLRKKERKKERKTSDKKRTGSYKYRKRQELTMRPS